VCYGGLGGVGCQTAIKHCKVVKGLLKVYKSLLFYLTFIGILLLAIYTNVSFNGNAAEVQE